MESHTRMSVGWVWFVEGCYQAIRLSAMYGLIPYQNPLALKLNQIVILLNCPYISFPTDPFVWLSPSSTPLLFSLSSFLIVYIFTHISTLWLSYFTYILYNALLWPELRLWLPKLIFFGFQNLNFGWPKLQSLGCCD